MARIRTIKPEFPQSESIGQLSRDARLLFLQLFTVVDDFGRARASSRMLASVLYPYDDDAKDLIDGWLDELEEKGHIRRYRVDGTLYLDIPNWLKHQKIDHPSKKGLPEFTEEAREGSRGLAPDLGPVPVSRTNIRSVAKATRPRRGEEFEKFKAEYPQRDGSNPWTPAEKLFDQAIAAGVDSIDLTAAARRYRAECDRKGLTGTEKVAQAQTWLRQKRWTDYADTPPTLQLPAAEDQSFWDHVEQTYRSAGIWSRHAGPKPGFPDCRAPPDVVRRVLEIDEAKRLSGEGMQFGKQGNESDERPRQAAG
ncbi:hypothetical protein M2222_008281 [Bradyrhizobium elkanii]|uniref:hypothetical protein n=1 Tax=Bradyrhizobium elkanii TaxID=29448 RepID=UPI0021682412|nr:hypothetical protein [Bradyrhizobium elkanii]MCS3451942.1 hypothetical protein [Bradyrhizobium elkanii]MCS3565959.1 hypothetical protein [Bradyrhizobium elkanii]MCW2153311.1 hypothetical protein [Bradyrhizobium elkanii]MCW2377044.1 hypothetical protein [Bradyrhizobium elkanii]